MRRHACDRPEEEVGGVLLGRHYATGERHAVLIHDFLAVPGDSDSAVQFDFDRSSIETISTRLQRSRGEYVVGWYHSHVLGEPFTSGTDQRTHRGHFPLPWQIAAVVSPGEWGVPVGLWRHGDDELVAVDDYQVRMVSSGPAAQRHQRFLRSCQLAPRRPGAPLSDAAALLPHLGGVGSVGAALYAAVARAGGADTGPDGSNPLRAVLAVAAAPAADPRAAGQLAPLSAR